VVQHKDFDSSKDGQLNVESDIVNEARKALSAGTFPFRAVGHGIMDIPGIVKAAEKAGAQWLVVEQDLPSPGQTPIECAKESLDYLNIMLISGGFVSPVPVLLKPSRGKALR
jgi:sugar phosphate isomerase/epimerase